MTALREALATDAIALTEPTGLGSRSVDVRTRRGAAFLDELVERLAESDDEVMQQYVEGARPVTHAEALSALARLSARGDLHPVFFGSALTGIGVDAVIDALRRYLPADSASADDPLKASVFKIERSPAGHTVAVARIFTGSLAPRDHVVYHRRSTGKLMEREGRATSVLTFSDGTRTTPAAARAGDIAKIVGLTDIAVGDQLGGWDPDRSGPACSKRSGSCRPKTRSSTPAWRGSTPSSPSASTARSRSR
jgi:ribosomal protection tetracycline resistance protein